MFFYVNGENNVLSCLWGWFSRDREIHEQTEGRGITQKQHFPKDERQWDSEYRCIGGLCEGQENPFSKGENKSQRHMFPSWLVWWSKDKGGQGLGLGVKEME